MTSAAQSGMYVEVRRSLPRCFPDHDPRRCTTCAANWLSEELDRHRRINLLRASEHPERMKEEDRLNELAERIEG